jgi:dihydrodipicolinate synthase/N-acetylneuraminate lyase
MQGRERLAAISLWSGADGLISAVANFAPRLLQALSGSVAGERPRGETHALQATIGELAGVFEQGDWLAGLKATLQGVGWNVGEPSPTIPPYTASQRLVVDGIISRPDVARWLTMPAALLRPSLSSLE